jgi:hypothetical protein
MAISVCTKLVECRETNGFFSCTSNQVLLLFPPEATFPRIQLLEPVITAMYLLLFTSIAVILVRVKS